MYPFLMFNIIAVSVPDAKALYPLNSWYTTRELNDKQPQGLPVGVSLASGPDGKQGTSYQFLGNPNSFIEFPNNGGLDVQHSITLLCWLYPESANDGPIFNYGSTGFGIHMWIASEGKLFGRFPKRDYVLTPFLTTTSPLTLNKWHHVGISYDHITGIASLWLNGKRVVQHNIGAGLSLATQDKVVRMGAKADDNRYLSGRITAMQVYDAALTARQINRMNNAGLGMNLFN